MNPAALVTESPFFNEIPDGIDHLFHYTDAGGLIGMVQYGKLWLTSIHYQNDSQEYHYAFSLVKEVLEESYPGLLEEWALGSRGKTSTVFTFSLSEKRDSLSQWRGYCPDGGFALSFRREQFNEFIKREKIFVAKCRYNKTEQKEFIKKYVIEFSPEYYIEKKALEVAPCFHRDMRIMYFNKYLFDRIVRIAPLLKYDGFIDEQEWRLIKVLQTSSEAKSLGDSVKNYIPKDTVKIRSRKDKLVPYIELVMNRDNGEPVAIDEVVISPTSHEELALDACNILLHTKCRDSINGTASNSKIPYINW